MIIKMMKMKDLVMIIKETQRITTKMKKEKTEFRSEKDT
jgi:hypothetical protein